MKYNFITNSQEETEKRDYKKSILPNIIEIYRNVLEVVIAVSSFFFIFWLLSFFISWTILGYIITIILFFLYFTTEGRHGYVIKNEIILRFSKSFLRAIKIIGSTIVIFLFLNSYLKITNFLNQQFLDIIPKLENILNIGIVAILFSILFILSYIYFSLALFNFIREKTNYPIAVIVEIIILFLPLIFIKEEIASFSVSFSEIIYSKLNWLIGFSLIFLHLNYLIREAIIFLKGRELKITN